MKQEDLDKISNSFRTFSDTYSMLEKGDHSCLIREYGTNNYPEIKWMIDYFLEKEEYEKCAFLLKFKPPLVSKEQLSEENRFNVFKNLD
jgi:hypothetical protein